MTQSESRFGFSSSLKWNKWMGIKNKTLAKNWDIWLHEGVLKYGKYYEKSAKDWDIWI